MDEESQTAAQDVLARLRGTWKILSSVADSVRHDIENGLELRFEGNRMFWPGLKIAVFEIEIEDVDLPFTLRNTLIGYIDQGRYLDFPLRGKPGRMTFTFQDGQMLIGYVNGSMRKLTLNELVNAQGKRLLICKAVKSDSR